MMTWEIMTEPSKPRSLTIEEVERLTSIKKRAHAGARAESAMRGRQQHPKITAWKHELAMMELHELAATYEPAPRKEPPRKPILDARSGRPAYEPQMLLSLARLDAALVLFFEGLRRHYIDCIASGRLDVWSAAAKATIDLCASVDGAEIVRRETLN